MTHVSQEAEAVRIARYIMKAVDDGCIIPDGSQATMARELLRLHEHKADKWCYYCKADTHNDAECWSTRPADWIAGGAPNRLILPAGVEHKADGGGREGEHNRLCPLCEEGILSLSFRDGLLRSSCGKCGSTVNGAAETDANARLGKLRALAPTRSGVIEEAIRACEAKKSGRMSYASGRGYDECIAALRALIPNPTKEALPEEPKPGWVWVPEEATEEMVNAGQAAGFFPSSVIKLWKAMLRALKEKG